MWEEGGGAYITPLSGSPYLVLHSASCASHVNTLLCSFGLTVKGCLQVWPVMHAKLTKRGLKSIPGEEAMKLQKRGATIIDVCVTKLSTCTSSITTPLATPC